MMKMKAALLAIFALVGAETADAQRFSVSFGKQTRNSSFSVRLGSGGGRYCPTPRRTWVAGHYTYEHRKVWVPGVVRKVWVDPIYEEREVRDGYGARRYERILVREGYWDHVREPGYYEVRRVRVWVPGHYR